MCYNAPMSFTFFGIGIATTLYIVLYNPYLLHMQVPMLLLFYSGMELLQGLQYGYVNQCSNNINMVLTEVAYIFVIVQPLLWNYFFYINSNPCDKQIFMVGMALALCWMVMNVATRIFYTPKLAMTKKNSSFAGKEACTKKNATHLFWEWPMSNFGEMNATYFTYLLIWFVPALVSTKFRMTSIILITSAILSVIVSFLGGEYYVFTSAWCYISVPIVIAVMLHLVFSKK